MNAPLQIPVDRDTEAKAAAALAAVGLSVPEAVALFLRRVASDQALLLDLKTPNAETRAAMGEAGTILRDRKARFADGGALLADLEEAGSR